MLRLKFSLFLFFCLVCHAGFAEGFSSSINSIDSSGFPNILVNLRVFTPEPVKLTYDNFILNENNNRIATFSVELTRKNPYLVLLLDRSSSMEPVVKTVQDAAVTFIRSLSKGTKTALITFASDVDIVQDFSSDAEVLIKGVKNMRAWGGTALYDGIYKAIDHLCAGAMRDDQKMVVVLTDGKDETPQGKPGFSIKKPTEVFQHAKRNGVRIICVGLGNSIDKEFLNSLAKETQGVFLEAPTATQLQDVFKETSRRIMLERRYKLAYVTPNPRRDGTRRDLIINSEHKGQKDQGKGFYLAPSDSLDASKNLSDRNKTASDALKIKNDLSLGRLKSPDLGSATTIGHLSHSQLGTYTSIATFSADSPEAVANPTIEAVNRENQELFERNQKEFDEAMDKTNKVIDETNLSNKETLQKAQEATDQGIHETNEDLENVEKTGKLDMQIPLPETDSSEHSNDDD